MADSSNVLSAKLEVKDSFTSQLNNFKNVLNSTENSFNKFVSKLEQSATKIEQTLDKISTKMEQTSNKIISQSDKVANSIIKSTTKVEQSQNKVTDDLLKKYTKMGGDIETIFKNVQKEADALNKTGLKVNINGGSKSDKLQNGSSGLFDNSKSENLITGILGGNFGRVITSLGVIGGAIAGATKILTTLDGWAMQGFNAMNSLSTGLLSVDGLKAGIESVGQFETNRIAMDVLYGNDSVKGQKYYAMGTKVAKDTTFSESDIGEMQKRLAGGNIDYTPQQLQLLADTASVKPELGASHLGFSILDSMYGRTSSLKTNYMLDNKEVQTYLTKLQKTDPTDAKKWQDAFNSKGTVNNKQSYFDLLMDYIEKEKNYKGLADRYSSTMSGMIDRLAGNWETLRADLLGIDANKTGLEKPGKVTVFSAVKDGITNLEKWLNKPETGKLLSDVGEGLGKAVNSVTTSVRKLLDGGKFEKIGEVFVRIGDSFANFIERLDKNKTLDKLLDKLPDLVEIMLNNEAIKLEGSVKTTSSLATGDVGGGAKNWLTEKQLQVANFMGDKNANWNTVDDLSKNKSIVGTWWDNYTSYVKDNINLTDANASTVLAKSDLNNDQRTQISDLIKNDNQATYGDIYIGSINANNFDEILNSLKQYQANKK